MARIVDLMKPEHEGELCGSLEEAERRLKETVERFERAGCVVEIIELYSDSHPRYDILKDGKPQAILTINDP